MATSHSTASVLVINHYDRLSPRVELEIRSLASAGYDVSVINWQRGNDVQIPDIPGVQFESIRHSAPRGTLQLVLHLPVIYAKLLRHLRKRRFDLVHVTHIMMLPLAAWLRWRWGASAIYDVYEFHLQETAERLPRGTRWLVTAMRRLEAWLVRHVDGVLTIDSAGETMERYYRSLNPNTAAIYNVPERDVTLDEARLAELKNKYRDRDIVIYVGGLSQAKGADKALEAAQQVAARWPRVLFLFIGAFQAPALEQRFCKIVSSKQMGDHVQWIPWMPYHDMLYYVAISHIGLALHQPIPRFFKLNTGNGRKFFTYMQFGIPIVAPEFGEIGKLVAEEQCGVLVDTTDPGEIATAVVDLLDHPMRAKVMGEQGKAIIRRRYNWNYEQEKLFHVYHIAFEKGDS